MTAYRQHQTQTILYEQFVADSAYRAEYERYARLVSDIIGIQRYREWCDACLPDASPWGKYLELVKEYYNQLAEELDHQEQMREERPA